MLRLMHKQTIQIVDTNKLQNQINQSAKVRIKGIFSMLLCC